MNSVENLQKLIHSIPNTSLNSMPDNEKNIFKNYKFFPIELLVSAVWNYKLDDDFMLKQLLNNIKRNGQIVTCQLRKLDTGYYEVVDGNHRLKAFKELGQQFVMAYDHGNISQAAAERLAIETNETKFGVDMDKLTALISELKDEFPEGDLLATLPFDFNSEEWNHLLDQTVDSINNETAEVSEDDFYQPEPTQPKTERGDLYELNGHRILCGDSTNVDNVRTLMNGKKAHLLFTDPPYNVNYAEFNKNRNENGKDWTEEYCSEWQDSMTDDDYKKFLIDFLRNAKDSLIEHAHYYVWHATTYFVEVIEAFKANNIPYDKVPIQWVKQVAPPSWVRYWRITEPCIFGGKGAVNGNGEGSRWFGPNGEVNAWIISREHNGKYIHPCLSPDSLIMTESGYKEIQTITYEDKVLGDDCVFHTIQDISSHNYNQDIYKISVEGTNQSILATNNHPFLIATPIKDKTSIIDWDISYKESQIINIGDYVLTPKIILGNQQPVSKEEAFLIGLFLADGSFQKAGHGDNQYLVFHLHKKETHLVDKIVDLYGDKVKIYSTKSNGITVMVFDKELAPLYFEYCSKGASTKQLNSKIWNWDKDLLEELLFGYLEGDGCCIRDYFTAKTVSPNLASQLCHIGDALGFRSTMYKYILEPNKIFDRKFKSVKPVYHLTFHPSNKPDLKRNMSASQVVKYKGNEFYLRRIKNIELEPYNDKVINLTVDGCHTFQTNIGMSHNTQKPTTLAGRALKNSSQAGEIVLDMFLGSGSTMIASDMLNRICFGMEYEPKFCDLIVLRFMKYCSDNNIEFNVKRNGDVIDKSFFNYPEEQIRTDDRNVENQND